MPPNHRSDQFWNAAASKSENDRARWIKRRREKAVYELYSKSRLEDARIPCWREILVISCFTFHSLEFYFSVGDHLTIADFAFVPQIRNLVDRWKIPIDDYPKVKALYENLKGSQTQLQRRFKYFLDIECIAKAHPDNQKTE
jgi:hypothetical protein